MSMNKAILLGRIARKTDLNRISDTTCVLNFSVATNEKWKDKESGDWVDKPTFHNLVAWNKTAETIDKFFNVGNQILIEGKIQTRSYAKEGADENDKRYVTEVVVEKFSFVDKKDDSGTASPAPQEREEAPGSDSNSPANDEDLPF